ncbi:UvrD-helicase domain-containing protein [Methylosinus sp. Sm6]|uniref:UvrD-helicase domain-containing protein n=1 Tax=Methylosinus sp. Sm6 TaxID=2866948 RepID=UPI001C996A7F|nr:ATP-dependent helicase [Methylosinus sp. Sm6]MBY6240062.1 ATP-dependent helicase [Methylosinus sp. Sm6]
MTFVSCPDRDQILSATGHVVVTGGPGSGKTTVALRKALLRIEAGLQPAQKVLFLSFSRAAVARIMQAARANLPRVARQSLDIQTFHSFCWQLVRGHGYLLGAPKHISLLAPHDERALRDGAKDDDPIWDAERERLFLAEGRIAFDLFAPKAFELFSRSKALRLLLADQYPLIIVDEAQDTGTEQWNCIATLADHTQLLCLADLDQQIYDFRRDVSPHRLADIMAVLKPLEIDLGAQNNRSPGVEILKCGNDILANVPRGTPYRGVSQRAFRPDATVRDTAIRQAVGMLYRNIKAETGCPPTSIGYLTNWGKGVTIIARALQGGNGVREIPHRVVMDEVEVLLATRVVALCLEPITDVWQALAIGLDLIAEVYRSRGNTTKAGTLRRAAHDARAGRMGRRARCPPALKNILEALSMESHTGEPGADWLSVRRRFAASGVEELKLIAQNVIYLMAFNRGRRIADTLVDTWQRYGSYVEARTLIEAAITEDQIVGAEGGLEGLNVMTMHKSKGKEFDGVILLHLGRLSPFSPDSEISPHVKSRRLLRVGITRARHHTLLLTDAFSPSPLLQGHRFNN